MHNSSKSRTPEEGSLGDRLLAGIATPTPAPDPDAVLEAVLHTAEVRRALRDVTGVTPIPIIGKSPPNRRNTDRGVGLTRWQSIQTPTDDTLIQWGCTWPDACNSGVLTRDLPTLDADILDEAAARAIEKLVRKLYGTRGRILMRVGQPPKRAFPFRSTRPFRKLTINFAGGRGEKLEFLGDGQQIVCHGTHPETGRPYEWHGGELHTVARAELPEITEAEARSLMEQAAELLTKDFGYTRSSDLIAGGGMSPDREVLVQDILNGVNLHDSLCGLAAKDAVAGVAGEETRDFLEALMHESKAPQDARWEQRFSDIPRLVASAERKFAQFALIEDWSTTAVGESLRKLADSTRSMFGKTPKHNWSDIDPVDLWATFDPPPLPRGLLPKLLEDFAFDQGETLGADPAGIALGALVVCAAAIPDRIKLQPKQHDPDWREEARIWGGLIGPVSAMKTPVMNTVVKPLRAIDMAMAHRNERAMAAYNRLPQKEKQQAEVPAQPRLMLQDTTIEAAQEVLKDSPHGVLCFRDELSGWFGQMDKYAGPRGAASDRAFWLQSFNGGPYAINRIGRGSTVIPNLSICVLGGVQPEPIRKIAEDSVDDGLLQRLIPVVLRPAVVGRDEARAPVAAEYDSLIGNLHRIGQRMDLAVLGGGTRTDGKILRFDAGAMAIRAQLEQKHLELQQCESLNRKLAAHVGKFNGTFCRLCVIWHCVEHVGAKIPAIVTADVAQRVADFLHGFLLPHALAFYAGTLGLAADHDRLAAVAGFILARRLDHVTNRDIQRGDGNMRNLKRRETDAIFEQLDALGWLAPVPGPRSNSPPRWIVNPAVHVKFATRAKAEAERRKRDRKMLAGVLRGTKTGTST